MKREDELLERLTGLAAAQFEEVVFKFDTTKVVPDGRSAQRLRAIELLRLARSRADGVDQLDKLIDSVLLIEKIVAHQQVQLDKTIGSSRVEALDGIFRKCPPAILHDIAPYAYAEIRQTLNSDLQVKEGQPVISALINDLGVWLEEDPDECPDLLRFVVVCIDDAASLKLAELKHHVDRLKTWLEGVCERTEWTIDRIRGKLRKRQCGLSRPAVEIAWPTSFSSQSGESPEVPEVYVRWGALRQRVDREVKSESRRSAVTSILSLIEADRALVEKVEIDHIEILVQDGDWNTEWEYCYGSSAGDLYPKWHPWPVAVRAASPSCPYPTDRACPDGQICDEHIATCDGDLDAFSEAVQDRGVFVSSSVEVLSNNDDARYFHQAIASGTIGLWTRRVYNKDKNIDERLRKSMRNQPVHKIPKMVHTRRNGCSPNSPWRHVVFLFDPNLPRFEFSDRVYSAGRQREINKIL